MSYVIPVKISDDQHDRLRAWAVSQQQFIPNDVELTLDQVWEALNIRHRPEDSVYSNDLAGWWRRRAETEIEQTVKKAAEYSGKSGGGDLKFMGATLFAIADRDSETQEAMEFGCWAYIMGKVGRVIAALREGREPSDDTIFDMKIYLGMIQRIREVGGWPDGKNTGN